MGGGGLRERDLRFGSHGCPENKREDWALSILEWGRRASKKATMSDNDETDDEKHDGDQHFPYLACMMDGWMDDE